MALTIAWRTRVLRSDRGITGGRSRAAIGRRCPSNLSRALVPEAAVIFRKLPTVLGEAGGRSIPMWFVDQDRAGDHADIEVQDTSDRQLSAPGCPSAWRGRPTARAELWGEAEADHSRFDRDGSGAVGRRADRGGGYRMPRSVFRQVASCRQRRGTPGAKSRAPHAHALAMVRKRIDAHELRLAAGTKPAARNAPRGTTLDGRPVRCKLTALHEADRFRRRAPQGHPSVVRRWVGAR